MPGPLSARCRRSALSALTRTRVLCTAPKPPAVAAKAIVEPAEHKSPSEQGRVAAADNSLASSLPLADAALRGVGQVVFCNSAVSGAVLLGALGAADLYLAALAALGTGTATLCARVGGFEAAKLKVGLAGYNGCLVGCAFAVLMGEPAWSVDAALMTVAGSAMSVGVFKLYDGSPIPQFTLAFNSVAISSLIVAREWTHAAAATVPALTSAIDLPVLELAAAPLLGISQIFVANSHAAGMLTLIAIGLYSRGCAAHVLLGSTIGTATAVALGAPGSEVAMGLWGYNSALTSLAVGVFFVHSPQAMLLSSCGASLTAALFGGMKGAAAATLGVPVLTLPFCITASACYAMHTIVPGLRLAAAPHSPEMNAP